VRLGPLDLLCYVLLALASSSNADFWLPPSGHMHAAVRCQYAIGCSGGHAENCWRGHVVDWDIAECRGLLAGRPASAVSWAASSGPASPFMTSGAARKRLGAHPAPTCWQVAADKRAGPRCGSHAFVGSLKPRPWRPLSVAAGALVCASLLATASFGKKAVCCSPSLTAVEVAHQLQRRYLREALTCSLRRRPRLDGHAAGQSQGCPRIAFWGQLAATVAVPGGWDPRRRVHRADCVAHDVGQGGAPFGGAVSLAGAIGATTCMASAVSRTSIAFFKVSV
jgi:hypothetical protein